MVSPRTYVTGSKELRYVSEDPSAPAKTAASADAFALRWYSVYTNRSHLPMLQVRGTVIVVGKRSML